ncbi:uncharacterized protein LOC114572868 [Perca flavescens]|uniref:uncharacterized protein LOC114572868 n=1 Tax=Perca flavescens TaxID=8167 RepID=UPI00106EB44E|nr:uncharacterized protein LOC114572868 [Perca flavescens]
MEEFKWIKMSLFLIPLLHFTAAAGNHLLSSTVRAGDDVTLSCKHVIDGQRKCDSTTWIFSGSGNTVPLFELGKIKEEAGDKSDRLSVRENCSLVIKKVTEEDAGLYICRQFRSGQQQGPDTTVVLTVTSWWWWLIVVFVAVAALLIITVAVIRWKRAKGNTPTYENVAHPEGGVSYASIRYTKKTNRRAQAQGGDEDDAVTYSTVKAPSSSAAAAASADLSNLYANVNKPKK